MLNACNLQHSPLLPSLLFVRWALHTSCIHDNVLTPARLTFCSRATTKRNMAFSIPPPVSVSVHPLSHFGVADPTIHRRPLVFTPSLDLHALFPRLKAGKGGKGSRITSPIPQLTKNLLKNPPKVGMAGDIPRSRPPTRRQPATSVRTSLLSFQLPLPLPPPPPHLSLSLSLSLPCTAASTASRRRRRLPSRRRGRPLSRRHSGRSRHRSSRAVLVAAAWLARRKQAWPGTIPARPPTDKGVRRLLQCPHKMLSTLFGC